MRIKQYQLYEENKREKPEKKNLNWVQVTGRWQKDCLNTNSFVFSTKDMHLSSATKLSVMKKDQDGDMHNSLQSELWGKFTVFRG